LRKNILRIANMGEYLRQKLMELYGKKDETAEAQMEQNKKKIFSPLKGKSNEASENMQNSPDTQLQQILDSKDTTIPLAELLNSWSIPCSEDVLEKRTDFSMDAELKKIYSILSNSEKELDKEIINRFKNPWEPLLLETLVENLDDAELINAFDTDADMKFLLMLDFYIGLTQSNAENNATKNDSDRTLLISTEQITDKIEQYFLNADLETLEKLTALKVASEKEDASSSGSGYGCGLSSGFREMLSNPKYVMPSSFYFSNFRQWFKEYRIDGLSDKMGLKAVVFFDYIINSEDSVAKAFEIIKPHLKEQSANIYSLISDAVKFSTVIGQIEQVEDSLVKYKSESESILRKIEAGFGSTDGLVENFRLLEKLPSRYSFFENLKDIKIQAEKAERVIESILIEKIKDYIKDRNIEKFAGEFEAVTKKNEEEIKAAFSKKTSSLITEYQQIRDKFQSGMLDALDKIPELNSAYSQIKNLGASLGILKAFDKSDTKELDAKIAEIDKTSIGINSKIIRNLDALQQKEKIIEFNKEIESNLISFASKKYPFNYKPSIEEKNWQQQFSFIDELKKIDEIAQKYSAEKFADYPEISETREIFSKNLWLLKEKIGYSVKTGAEELEKLLEAVKSDYFIKTWDIQTDLAHAKERKADIENIKRIYEIIRSIGSTSEEVQVKIMSSEPQISEMQCKLEESVKNYANISEQVKNLRKDIPKLQEYFSIASQIENENVHFHEHKNLLKEMMDNLSSYGSKYSSADSTAKKYLENSGLQGFTERSSEIYKFAMQNLNSKADVLAEKIEKCHEKIKNTNFLNSLFSGGVSAVRKRIVDEMWNYMKDLDCIKELLESVQLKTHPVYER